MSKKYAMPAGMQEAILVVETGFSPEQLDRIPEAMLERIMLYRKVRSVMVSGGSFDG